MFKEEPWFHKGGLYLSINIDHLTIAYKMESPLYASTICNLEFTARGFRFAHKPNVTNNYMIDNNRYPNDNL